MIRFSSASALVLAFLAGALVALLATRLLESPDGAKPAVSAAARSADRASGSGEAGERVASTSGQAELSELRSALEIDRAIRERLIREVQRLQTRLAEVEHAGLREDDAKALQGAGGRERAGGERAASEDARRDSTAGWFGADGLIAVGMDPSQVEFIRRRWEQREMDKLYLADEYARAAARGERRRGKLAALMAIERSAFDDLGEDGYDAMLYASNEKNRVRLTDVIDESPADLAGLEPGDEVLRYDGNRIYRLGLLKKLTTQGKPGQSVDVAVLRGSEQLHFSVARGPLGVRTEAVRSPPVLPSVP